MFTLLKKIILLLCLAYISGGCKKNSPDAEPQAHDNVWLEEKNHPWDRYTVVASNQKIAYYAGNSIYKQTDQGFTKIADYPEQNYLEKFAFVSGNGDLITGGGYSESGANVSWKFYKYSPDGTLLATLGIPNPGFGEPYYGPVHTIGEYFLTSVSERQLSAPSTTRQKYIYVWDPDFKYQAKIKIDNNDILSEVFSSDGNIYLLFSDGTVRKLAGNKLEDAPVPDLMLDEKFGGSIPKLASSGSKLVYGWPARVEGNEYRPSDLMIVTDHGVSRAYEGAPEICAPQLYYLNDTLFVAGGYTGSVDQKNYNDILYKIKLSEAAP